MLDANEVPVKKKNVNFKPIRSFAVISINRQQLLLRIPLLVSSVSGDSSHKRIKSTRRIEYYDNYQFEQPIHVKKSAPHPDV